MTTFREFEFVIWTVMVASSVEWQLFDTSELVVIPSQHVWLGSMAKLLQDVYNFNCLMTSQLCVVGCYREVHMMFPQF